MGYLNHNLFDNDIVIRNGKLAVNTTNPGASYIADFNGNVNINELYISGVRVDPVAITGYDPFIESAKKITMDYNIKDDMRSYVYETLEIETGVTVQVGSNSELSVADFGTL